jgi:hypothetical protein
LFENLNSETYGTLAEETSNTPVLGKNMFSMKYTKPAWLRYCTLPQQPLPSISACEHLALLLKLLW